IMVISAKIQQDFENLAKNSDEHSKIVRIYNPLDTDEILGKANEPIGHYKFSNSVKTFVSVGTVFPQKGFDRLLKAHKRLLGEGFEHRILILGDGYDFENLKNLQKVLGLSESVTLLGYT